MQAIDNRNVYGPLALTPQQQRVLEALKDTETEKFPLSQWYHGALYALDNPGNPDRISQAAQSLRELLEKLPLVVEGIDIHRKTSGHVESRFPQMRRNIEEHISTYKERNPGDWNGQKIDNDLAKALKIVEEYIELNKRPTRRQKMQKAVAIIDPMVDRLDSKIQETKRNQLLNLWQRLEHFAHHNSKPDEEKFRKCLEDLEKTVFDLLAPITAQDQREIQTILQRPDRSESDVEQVLSLIERRGANFAFFFKHASETADATWLPFLNARDYFANPPSAQRNDDGWEIFPFWWPIHYLAKIANQVPDEVIEIVRELPKVDNPRVYNGILEIALSLQEEQSAALKPKILESIDIDHQAFPQRYEDLLAHWVAENQTSAALELTKVLVEFLPDPQSEAKQNRRRKNSTDFGTFYETSLEPSPRIGSSEYSEIMSKGVRPLTEKEPYQIAHLLIDVTANMIRLRMHQEELNQGVDSSQIWYERFHELDIGYEDPDKTLVHTLIFACEQVYEKSPDLIITVDDALRDQQWEVFKHLRQHLYAQYLNEQTKPWIRELILGHEGYHLWEHRYEFQRMIRRACKHFGASLLTKAERAQIFEAIRSGPSRANYQAWVVEWLGEEFTEERFQQRQRGFYRKQFKPFEPVLFGEYATAFRELEDNAADPISDEDYPPIKTMGGPVSNRSPRPPKNLASLTDEELLSYINEWNEKELFSEGDSIVEIDIEGLARAFQTVFKETIIPDAKRLRFWMENGERIARPTYVRMMINVMQAEIKEKNFDRLNEWLRFSEWVLSHPDQEYEGDHSLGIQGDESEENPDWYNSREIVGNLIGTCLEKEVDVPVEARERLAKLLEMLCTQYDRYLDQPEEELLNRNDLIDTAINNTRGRALETLAYFGFWLRRHDSESVAPEITTILEKRFAPETACPLTLPEYAILGRDYRRIFSLNKIWAVEHKSDLFPQDKLPAWLEAFSSFLHYNPPFERIFEIFQDDFDFALQYLADLKKREASDEKQTDIFGRPLKQNNAEEKLTEGLGHHLFNYYLWKMYPLRGSVRNKDRFSPLERYYQATSNNPERWANLFNYVGRMLWKKCEPLDKDLEDRIIAFFNWRVNEKESTELQQFTFWLQAKCLEGEWRLEAYAKILDFSKPDDLSTYTQLKTLCELLPDHTAKVVECFTKLTDKIKNSNIYITVENAKIILKAGFSSSDEDVYKNAESARENLLIGGKLNISDFND